MPKRSASSITITVASGTSMPDLDHGRGHQTPGRRRPAEALHDLFFCAVGIWPCSRPTRQPAQRPRRQPLVLLGRWTGHHPIGLLDQRADHIRPMAGVGLVRTRSQAAASSRPARPRDGGDGRPPRWLLVDRRSCRGRRTRPSRRSGNGCGRHHQQVGVDDGPDPSSSIRPLARSPARCSTPNRCCSSTTTAPRTAEPDVLGQQRVGADRRVHLDPTRSQLGDDPGPLLGRYPVGEEPDRDRPGAAEARRVGHLQPLGEQAADAQEVLVGQHLGRGHERALVTALDRRQHRPHRDHGLARADVALQEPVHRQRAGHVAQIWSSARRWAPSSSNGSGRDERADEGRCRHRSPRVATPRGGSRWRRRSRARRRSTRIELQSEELVEDESVPGRPWLVGCLRLVDRPEAAVRSIRSSRAATPGAPGRRAAPPVQRLLRVRPRSPSCRDRPWPTPGTPGSPGASGSRRRRSRLSPRGRRPDGPSGAAPGTRSASPTRAAGTGGELLLAPGLVEEDEREVSGARRATTSTRLRPRWLRALRTRFTSAKTTASSPTCEVGDVGARSDRCSDADRWSAGRGRWSPPSPQGPSPCGASPSPDTDTGISASWAEPPAVGPKLGHSTPKRYGYSG